LEKGKYISVPKKSFRNGDSLKGKVRGDFGEASYQKQSSGPQIIRSREELKGRVNHGKLGEL